jgi:hypothetical protein
MTDVPKTAALIASYNEFINLVLSYQLETRAFDPPLLDVRFSSLRHHLLAPPLNLESISTGQSNQRPPSLHKIQSSHGRDPRPHRPLPTRAPGRKS